MQTEGRKSLAWGAQAERCPYLWEMGATEAPLPPGHQLSSMEEASAAIPDPGEDPDRVGGMVGATSASPAAPSLDAPSVGCICPLSARAGTPLHPELPGTSPGTAPSAAGWEQS